MSLPSNLPPLEQIKQRVREQNAFARDARQRHLDHESERVRRTDASSSHGVPPSSRAAALRTTLASPSPSPLPEHIPSVVQECCIVEFQNFMTFRRKILDVTAATFIQGFDDCKVHLQKIISYLKLHGIQADSTDEEVETSMDED